MSLFKKMAKGKREVPPQVDADNIDEFCEEVN